MNLKVILGWLAIAFIVWFIIVQPHTVAQWGHDIWQWLTSVARGLSVFFSTG